MQIPYLTEVRDEDLKDPNFIKTLEDILMAWEAHIAKVIEECLKKVSSYIHIYLRNQN